MRWLLLAALVTGCTRQNPLGLPESGDLATGDLASPQLDLAVGDQPVYDLAGPRDLLAPPDLALRDAAAVDLAHVDGGGVTCGAMSCAIGCCVTQQGAFCPSAGMPCTGLLLNCDGPEDCTGGDICCGGQAGSMCRAAPCGGNTVRLCHSPADCRPGANCCPFMQSGVSYCTDRACP